MDLVNLASFTQVPDNGQDFRARIFQTLSGCSQAQLKSVVRTVHNRLVPPDRLKYLWRVPVVGNLIAKRQSRRVVGMAGQSYIVLFGNGDRSLDKIGDSLPVILGIDPA